MTRLLLLAGIVLLLAACKSAAPEGVRYINYGADESEEHRVKGGLNETEPGSGKYDIVLMVLNVKKGPATFSLEIQDKGAARTIWQSERIADGKTFMEMAVDDSSSDETAAEMARVARLAIVTVRGTEATLTVNGSTHDIELIEGRSRVWLVMLNGDRASVTHFDMH